MCTPVSTASQNEVPATPLEELTYRRSLRVALDVLNERSSLSPESCVMEDGAALSQKEKPRADAASPVSQAPSPSVLGEDGQDVVAQCAPKRRWGCMPQSLSGLSAFEEDPGCKVDHKTALSKNGTPRTPVPSRTADGSHDGSGSRLDRGQEGTTNKRRRNVGEKASRHRRTESSLSKGESVAESAGQASCVSPASPRLPSQTQKEDPCARVTGCDQVTSSGSSGLLPASERGRERSTKRPRLDSGQHPPTRQLGTRTVGAAPSPRSCSGEAMMLRSAGDSDRPEEGNHGQGCLPWVLRCGHGVYNRLSAPGLPAFPQVEWLSLLQIFLSLCLSSMGARAELGWPGRGAC